MVKTEALHTISFIAVSKGVHHWEWLDNMEARTSWMALYINHVTSFKMLNSVFRMLKKKRQSKLIGSHHKRIGNRNITTNKTLYNLFMNMYVDQNWNSFWENIGTFSLDQREKEPSFFQCLSSFLFFSSFFKKKMYLLFDVWTCCKSISHCGQ